MIISDNIWDISPIALSVLLIGYLMLIELGNKKIKKMLAPMVIVLVVVFLVIAVLEVLATYNNIK